MYYVQIIRRSGGNIIECHDLYEAKETVKYWELFDDVIATSISTINRTTGRYEVIDEEE